MTELLRHAFFHALTDAGKLFPVLLATYLALEYLEQKAGGKTLDLIRKSGRLGPLVGALCGIFPQCGLAAAAANFYAARVISAGTLLAVFRFGGADADCQNFAVEGGRGFCRRSGS